MNCICKLTLTLTLTLTLSACLLLITGPTVAAAAVAVAADDMANRLALNIETNRIFGSEHPGLYKHPASLTELSNGDLYVAYYGGSGEYNPDTAVYGSRRVLGEKTWSAPAIIADTPFRADGNPVVWQAPDGIVWLFHVTLFGETWSDARTKAKISKDGGHTWSDSFMLSEEKGSMVRGKPIVLMNGDYLLPMYHETGEDREKVGADTVSFFLRYTPTTNTWTETSRIRSPQGNLQPQVVQLNENYLICYMRRGGGYGPESQGFVLKSESHDGGHKWSDAAETEFRNPNSAVDVEKLKNGHLALVFNDHMYLRTPLSIAISTDQGQTFPFRRNIGGGDNVFAYPYIIQTRDERILVLYTTNNRTTIMLAEFNESAILKFDRN